MKRIITVILILSLCMSLMMPVFTQADNGAYNFLAADSLKTGNFSTYNYNGTKVVSFSKSKNYYEGDLAQPTEPTLQYSFYANESKVYHIWIKALVISASADSIWAKFDTDIEYTKAILPIDESGFKWCKVYMGYLEKGEHTIDLYPRERKLDVMNVCVSDDILYVPTGEFQYPVPEIRPQIEGHPRVLFTKNDIENIKEKLKSSVNSTLKQTHEKALRYSSAIPVKNNANFINYVRSCAFECVINGDKEKGKNAISDSIKYYDNILKLTVDEFGYAEAGNLIYMGALVYDWCFYEFESAEKREEYLGKIIQIASKYTEIGWPPLLQNGWTGHGCESALIRDMLSLGIAAYDEHPYIYNITMGRILDEYVDIRNFYYDAHKSLYGSSYGLYRGRMDMVAMLLMKVIGVDNIWKNDNIHYFPYWFLYATRSDGGYLSNGDTTLPQMKDVTSKQHSAAYPYYVMGSVFNDGYLIDAYEKEVSPVKNEYLECIIASNPDVEKKDISELPYSKYFGYPSGSYIARTGWEDNAMVVEMKVNELDIKEHNHQDAGAFQIYYKGALATDSGYYQSVRSGDLSSMYGSSHHVAYSKQTIAHNCMLVYDPDEPLENFAHSSTYLDKNLVVNSGGQVNVSRAGKVDYPETVEEFKNSSDFNTSKVLAHEHNEDTINPDFTYLKGDLSGAYSEKVKEYERSFMFLNLHNDETPGALIVFDHVVSSDENFKKTYLLHGVNAPEINGTRTILKREESHNGYKYNGKLVNDTLLPLKDNLSITQVGEKPTDFLINGVNYPSDGVEGGVNEGGGIRTEISPKIPSNEDYFLNVMQVSDADNSVTPLEATLITSDTHTGVRIADRVVMFGNKKERIKDNLSFSFDGEGIYKISVSDLESGKWDIFRNGQFLTEAISTEDGGIISFDGSAGEYEIYKSKNITIYTPSQLFGDFNYYNNSQAFIAFGKITGIEDVAVYDYGFLISGNSEDIENNLSDVKKASVKNNFESLYTGTDERQFGVIFYGSGIKNSIYIRPYFTYMYDSKTKTQYGDINNIVIDNLKMIKNKEAAK